MQNVVIERPTELQAKSPEAAAHEQPQKQDYQNYAPDSETAARAVAIETEKSAAEEQHQQDDQDEHGRNYTASPA